jgi:hypothetical protein
MILDARGEKMIRWRMRGGSALAVSGGQFVPKLRRSHVGKFLEDKKIER